MRGREPFAKLGACLGMCLEPLIMPIRQHAPLLSAQGWCSSRAQREARRARYSNR